ncbi:unnamed protein product [Prorocentrum cordatum]|uniref:Uncharacterized protein n=1 Tax=Prorocentrum cordatum TaxID=2364126 RepID=A0ABN9XKI6_9DINO|nr:unnamed protein product [Polarella glacialis]
MVHVFGEAPRRMRGLPAQGHSPPWPPPMPCAAPRGHRVQRGRHRAEGARRAGAAAGPRRRRVHELEGRLLPLPDWVPQRQETGPAPSGWRIAWYESQSISIDTSRVYMFDDLAENIAGFQGSGMHAHQISCGSRDSHDASIGMCGGRPEDITLASGVTFCS